MADDKRSNNGIACGQEIGDFVANLLLRYTPETLADRLDGAAASVRKTYEAAMLRARQESWRSQGVDPSRKQPESFLKTGLIEPVRLSEPGREVTKPRVSRAR